jgi:hypothetical protein
MSKIKLTSAQNRTLAAAMRAQGDTKLAGWTEAKLAVERLGFDRYLHTLAVVSAPELPAGHELPTDVQAEAVALDATLFASTFTPPAKAKRRGKAAAAAPAVLAAPAALQYEAPLRTGAGQSLSVTLKRGELEYRGHLLVGPGRALKNGQKGTTHDCIVSVGGQQFTPNQTFSAERLARVKQVGGLTAVRGIDGTMWKLSLR